MPVRYRIEYRHSTTNDLVYQTEAKDMGFDVEATLGRQNSEEPVFEIVARHKTTRRSDSVSKQRVLPPTSSMSLVSMRIHSRAIIKALQSVVQYYPGQDLTGDIVEINSPYAIIVHHYDDLVEYRERCAPEAGKELCHRDMNAYEQLGFLKEFLDRYIMPAVEAEKERNRRGFHTFDMFWVQLKPGNTLISTLTASNETRAGVIHSVSGGTMRTPSTDWRISLWSLSFDGMTLGRVKEYTEFSKSDGEQESAMSIIPGMDLEERPQKDDIETLITQGERFSRLVQKQCKQYRGTTKDFPHNEVDGLVMADVPGYFSKHPHKMPNFVSVGDDSRTWVSDCNCPVCSSRKYHDKINSVFAEYDCISPKSTEDLTRHQYLLCPSHIPAFVFRTRTWETLDVMKFTEPEFDESMIDSLVMDPKHVATLKALAKSFARRNRFGEVAEREPWTADFVKGKGHGLIFLLHGSPGVGKTCTAECIAAFTRRPLMVLTSSDIGTDPVRIEANLTAHFKTARSWGAVLLIDEADVFMERRSSNDLARNSLVAGFLRALEFYDGILFLTTNRVGSFDDAFISRIHVQLYYPEFDDKSRQKVWQTFVDKLKRERGDYIRLNNEAKEYLAGKEMKSIKWNGREIRNAFQTAVALAEYESQKDSEGTIVLTDTHLKAVVEMSRDFKSYLEDLHKGNEAKRAERRYERLQDSEHVG